MSRPRDAQRGQCYEAEITWFYGTLMGERQSFEALVQTTREIEATPEWRAVCSVPITIAYNEGARSYAKGKTISYAGAGAHRSSVPHEMAHVITSTDIGHGHLWRSAFVWVVRLSYGDEWADSLADGFASSKLSFDVLPLARREPLFPPEIFEATVGGPLFTPPTSTPRGPIAL